ncbi:TolC family protein [Rubinisphaera sp.]|uniref:TolC family protein n=1 Tax=Rubinisphaera sp. TaxID=2024857 RepID=UPI0025EDEB7C|nr:TolC family protein [Rubinisphaera sp.]|tara:strand:- start:9961 stop:11598 length:1638 start_codon:yes stop_codon:yes gene_type:complete
MRQSSAAQLGLLLAVLVPVGCSSSRSHLEMIDNRELPAQHQLAELKPVASETAELQSAADHAVIAEVATEAGVVAALELASKETVVPEVEEIVQTSALEDESEVITKPEPQKVELAIAEESDAIPSNSNQTCLTEYSVGAGSTMTLNELENLALENNPTLKQANASIVRSQGFYDQVGRGANPTVGYFGSQIADEGTDQHGLFFEREFVRGGKLQLNRDVLSHATSAQQWELETQRMRVLTDVRVRFFAAIAAQQELKAATEFVEVTTRGVEIAQMRKDALEDTQIEVLQSKTQNQEAILVQQKARIAYEAAWMELTALIGLPCLGQAELLPPTNISAHPLNECSLYEMMLCNSPEMATAKQRVAQARAKLSRQEVQAIPNITAQIGAGFDNSTDAGLINLQISAPLPVYNKNRGNISASYAEYCRATNNVTRIRCDIKARLARVIQQYESARVTVNRYENEILPQTNEALKLSSEAYDQGELGFLQILVIRKTYLDARFKSIAAHKELAQAQAQLDGLLLTGGLEEPQDVTEDDSLRGQTFTGQ